MFRPNCRAVFRQVFEQLDCTIDNAFQAVGPKHVAGIIIQYNLIKYKVVYDCVLYIFYVIFYLGSLIYRLRCAGSRFYSKCGHRSF